jgi:hypothetical protein
MATPAAAIEPGSIPYGDRQTAEQNLAGLGGGAPPGGVPGGGGPPTPGAAPPIPTDPLGALLSGDVVQPSGEPITDGLNVGPGFSPGVTENLVPDALTERLRLLAQHAQTPELRVVAHLLLKQKVRERSNE